MRYVHLLQDEQLNEMTELSSKNLELESKLSQVLENREVRNPILAIFPCHCLLNVPLI